MTRQFVYALILVLSAYAAGAAQDSALTAASPTPNPLAEEDYERLPQFTWREENLDESMRRNLLTIAFLLTPAALLALLAAFYVRRYHPILA